jgi:hypothetical protein
MKFIFVSLLLASVSAHADYVPGRTRASARAAMEVISGDGVFQGSHSAKLVEYTTDREGITQYMLEVDGRLIPLKVKKFSQGHCGDTYLAEKDKTALMLRDMSYAECNFKTKHLWEAQLTYKEGSRVSHLLIGGDPEHLVLTQ